MKVLYKIRLKQHIIRNMFRAYYFDAKRFYNYATQIDLESYSQNRLIGFIIAKYHIIEKGLTMHNMRLGFGSQVVNSLLTGCKTYLNKYDNNNRHIEAAVIILKDYVNVHAKAGYCIDKQLLESINELAAKFNTKSIDNSYPMITSKSYFENSESPFHVFAYSRHSIRSFSNGTIPIELMNQVIELAQSAPTSCNRQPIRIRIIENEHLKQEILKIQTGNRGFGSSADKLIIVSAEISVYNEIRERNLVYIDSGIYAMNLLYALHYYKVGACALNWSANTIDDIKLRKLLSVPDSEIISLIIACGFPLAEFKLATSIRNKADEITKIY